MNDILIGILIVHLATTAFGLAVIESVREVVEDKLHSEGYVRKNRNSLYNFNDGFSNFLKGFIPFYYFGKSLSLIGNKKAVNKTVKKEIDSGNYIKREELQKQLNAKVQVIEDKPNDITVKPETEIIFEKPERYKARKIDYSVYDTYETPIEYITRETSNDEKLEITPFKGNNETVEHVLVKSEVSNSDIAQALVNELNVEEREKIINLLNEVNKREKEKELKLEKDVA